jgi:hypothetical protein
MPLPPGTASTPTATQWWSSDPESPLTFSNPAGKAAGAASAYVRALLDLLGPRAPLPVIRELHPWLEERLRGVSDARLRQPEAPGKWSVLEVIQHLADSDLVAGFRIRMMLTEDRPNLARVRSGSWARVHRAADRSDPRCSSPLRQLKAG